MSYTHIHLLLNHFPIIGSMIGTVLLLLGIWKKNSMIQQVSLALLIIMAVVAIPVFLTGEPAEESVEELPGVIKSVIEEHEEAAEIAFWVMMGSGILSFISLILDLIKNKMANRLILMSLLSSIAAFGMMARTGYLGGQIRHTEISQIPTPGGQTDGKEIGKEQDDD